MPDPKVRGETMTTQRTAELQHASGCDVYFHPSGRCSCPVAEVARMRVRIAELEAELAAPKKVTCDGCSGDAVHVEENQYGDRESCCGGENCCNLMGHYAAFWKLVPGSAVVPS